ncbi:MAG TPA: hypothetical protein VMG81_03420 [Thermoplasmata archaeon]|nr:hypothetical protein [Thermoplasmata archaeon]
MAEVASISSEPPTKNEVEKERPRGPPLRFHDTHQAWTPCCNDRHLYTDSRSMMSELKAAGLPDPLELLTPIEVLFQGERSKLFVVKCKCGKNYIAFIDIVNRERIETMKNDILPYNPELAGNADFQKRHLEPKRRDVILSKEEFARRVAREKNHMVREAIERKCDAAGLGIPWVRTKLAYTFAAESTSATKSP